MSSTASAALRAPDVPDAHQPAWFAELLGAALPAEGDSITMHGRTLTMRGGILRARELTSQAQEQTKSTFAFKWAKRDTFEGAPLDYLRQWLKEKYGDVAHAPWLAEHGEHPVVLDAGCGAAMSALALFEPVLGRIRYIGADVSAAVDVARDRFAERGLSAAFLQADLRQLPLPAACADIIFSEGVLHHTDDTRGALADIVRHLKPGGRILFYVYRKKGPVREFTDDYIRDKLQAMTPQEGWDAVMALSKFGKLLGDLKVEVDIAEPVDLLDIPAGRIDLQRLFYWHVCKAFYRPEMTLDEMNNINFDWFAPKNAHRQTPDEVRAWCRDLSLVVEHERVEEAGITIIARRSGG
jgi:SAM-dependent methyltransferase